MATTTITRSRASLFASVFVLKDLLRLSIIKDYTSPLPSSSFSLGFFSKKMQQGFQFNFLEPVNIVGFGVRHYHDGRPRGPLWRGKKLIGKEALFVIQGLKRFKDDDGKLDKFIKSHVMRLLKMDLVAVLIELERQEEVTLAVKLFRIVQKQNWYEPDVFLYKDLIIALAKCKRMDEVMGLWEDMRKENLFPDHQTYAEVIRGFLRDGSPADAMNIYEDMKTSPDPPEQLPFRILLKGLLPHPLLRNRVKQDFEEIFPDQNIYDPPEEIFGLR